LCTAEAHALHCSAHAHLAEALADRCAGLLKALLHLLPVLRLLRAEPARRLCRLAVSGLCSGLLTRLAVARLRSRLLPRLTVRRLPGRRLTVTRLLRGLLRLTVTRLLCRRLPILRLLRLLRLSVARLLRLPRLPVSRLLRLLLLRLLSGITGLAVGITRGVISAGRLVHGTG
jgi:hypothetical protein